MAEREAALQRHRGRALREKEAANFLGLSESTLPTWRCRGKGPKFVKQGRSVRYYEADLEAFLDANTVTPGA